MPGFATSDDTKSQRDPAHARRSASPSRSSTSARPPSRCSSDLGHPFGRGEEVYDVTFENVQAGLRTDYLFRLANQRGGIVLGTGDLSELALGWCTYGVGDQMSHYGVNAGVPKTLIQHLIRWVVVVGPVRRAGQRRRCSRSSTQEITPRAGARPRRARSRRRTEDSVGPYALQDFTLFHVLRRGYRPSKIAFLAWHAWRDAERGGVAAGLPRGRARRPTTSPTIRHWLEVFVQALLRQPVQALGAAQRPQGRAPAARCRRAATGGCRPTPARAPGSPSSTPTSRRPEAFSTSWVSAAAPLVGEQGVAQAVEPLARPVQRLLQGVDLAPHPDPLHEAPRRLVVGEAVGGDPPQPELVEAEPQQLAHGLGGVAVAGWSGWSTQPSSACTPRACSLTSAWAQASPTLTIRSPMTAPSSSTTRTDREPVGVRELGAVLLDRRGGGGEPPADLGEPSVLPGRVEVVDGGAPQGQPGGAHRPRHGIERAAHRPMVSAAGDVRSQRRRPGLGRRRAPGIRALTARGTAGTLPRTGLAIETGGRRCPDAGTTTQRSATASAWRSTGCGSRC